LIGGTALQSIALTRVCFSSQFIQEVSKKISADEANGYQYPKNTLAAILSINTGEPTAFQPFHCIHRVISAVNLVLPFPIPESLFQIYYIGLFFR